MNFFLERFSQNFACVPVEIEKVAVPYERLEEKVWDEGLIESLTGTDSSLVDATPKLRQPPNESLED